MKNIDLPTKWYNPFSSLPTNIDQSLATTKEIEMEDTLGATFDFTTIESDEDLRVLSPTTRESWTIGEEGTKGMQVGRSGSKEADPIETERGIGAGDNGGHNEIESLLTKAMSIRQFVVDSHAEKLVNDAQVVTILAQMHEHAQKGDRQSYSDSNVQLMILLEGD